jgi:hypothetical protein
MIPLTLFLLGVAAVYVGTIETAFSALMKLSLRLMAERGRDDRARLLPRRSHPAVRAGAAAARPDLLARDRPARRAHRPLGLTFASIATLLACVASTSSSASTAAVDHRAAQSRGGAAALLPPLQRGSPRDVADLAAARAAADERQARAADRRAGAERGSQGEVAHAYLEAGEEQGLIEGDERGCCSRSSTSATRSRARS